MTKTTLFRSLAVAVAMTAAACSGTPQSPLSPSAATSGSLGVNPDGSTLKIGQPGPVSPGSEETLETNRPTFVFTNAVAPHLGSVVAGVSYRLQLLSGDSTVLDERTVAQGDGTTTYEADIDLANGTDFGWRVRAELDDAVGPWSDAMFFTTPAAQRPGGTPTGTVGAPRTIGLDEAVAIIRFVYDDRNVNIGRSSSRGGRNAALEMAVAVLHYGHPQYNAAGPDPPTRALGLGF